MAITMTHKDKSSMCQIGLSTVLSLMEKSMMSLYMQIWQSVIYPPNHLVDNLSNTEDIALAFDLHVMLVHLFRDGSRRTILDCCDREQDALVGSI